MAIKLSQSENIRSYFCTFTCKDWINLFEITSIYGKIYDWFNLLIEKGNEIEGFVIMPNHLHLLVFVGGSSNINTLLTNGKRFLAYDIIKQLQFLGHCDLLLHLEEAVTPKEKIRKKKHRVFEISSDIKPCYTEKFLLQKLNYMHQNPLSGKWKLTSIPEEYFHSSAGFYMLNEDHPLIKITHWRDVGGRGS